MMYINEKGKEDKPHNHPIVEQDMERLKELADIRTFNISISDKEIILKAFLRINWLESEVKRLTAAIRQKDNALEVCGDRRWEAEEKVGELMDEIERLKTADIENVRR